MKKETIAIHAGNIITDNLKPAIQPITTSTTFIHQEVSPGYTRANNPNRGALEQVLAQLEGGKEAAAFSSGNASAMAVFQAIKPGSHIIAPDDMYHGIRHQLIDIFKDILTISYVDMGESQKVKNAIQNNTVLIWVETPSNPLLKICDVRAIAAIAKENKLKLACDNTFATPIFQNPLSLGADIVMHSTTKYLGGHSDILGGALITKETDDFWERIRMIQQVGGAVPSPFDCYLLTRSIKTLPYRMRGHYENAHKLAHYLQGHPQVEKVYYPGLESHPNHEIAASQMHGFGGMLSFLFKGGAADADAFVQKLQIFTNATSLGGVESLIERRAASEGPDTATPQNLLRVSVGLEHIDDLVADMDGGFGN